ncbi:MAG: methyltransferase domain-containing protein [Solirubrobacterales bacterium]|nr:methyltransferase domain-containing protein [Solirubrobacterales bacterium]
MLGGRRFRIWRPTHPLEVQDPYAERGDAGPIWSQAWTSGVVLAGLLARCPLHGVRVLELGCGLGLVAIAAARAGGRVMVSDRSGLALAFTALNADENRVAVETVQCDWQSPHALEVHGPWDLVLGSDILYVERSAHALTALLDRVVAADGEVWITDPGRAAASAFLASASTAWRLSDYRCGHGVLLHRLARPSTPHPKHSAARRLER